MVYLNVLFGVDLDIVDALWCGIGCGVPIPRA